jgi:transposase
MATMPHTEMFVTVGVDTHKDIHVAVALDQLGRKLDAIEIPTTSAGYAELLIWATGLGTVDRFGIEGTGSHGAGLCRWLTARGLIVIEVDRPDRQAAPQQGQVRHHRCRVRCPQGALGRVDRDPQGAERQRREIRILRLTRRSAVVAQGQASNQIHALIATAPDELRDQLRDLTTRKRVAVAAAFRPTARPTPSSRRPSSRSRSSPAAFLDLDAEIKDLNRRLDELVEATAPALVARRGIGTHTAATLLVTAGDNPERLRSEASFAALAGTSPLEASSGPRNPHRLNRGGDRDANAALHMIAVNRLANGHEPTRAYVRKRTGGTKPTSTRCDASSATSPERSTPCFARPSRTIPTQYPELLDGYRRVGSGFSTSTYRPHSVSGAPSGMKVPMPMSWSSGRIRSVLGPLEGNSSRSTHRAVYQPARPHPIWTSHGQTADGGASMVIAWSVTTCGSLTMSSPGRLFVRSARVDP